MTTELMFLTSVRTVTFVIGFGCQAILALQLL